MSRISAAACVLALVAIAAMPMSDAHLMQLDHVNPVFGSLAPGANDTDFVRPNNESLEAGWEFVVAAIVDNATLEIRLVAPSHRVVANWSVEPGATARESTSLPETGNYSLTFHNPGTRAIRYIYYYDQSCNCIGKPVPIEIPHGIVVFNVDPPRGKSLDALFPEPPAMTMKVTAATRVNASGVWPRDFQIVAESDTPNAPQDPKAPPARVHELKIAPTALVRYYFFVEPLAFDRAKFASADDVLVTPDYTLAEVAKSPVPAVGASVTLAVALALAFALVAGGTRPRRR
ncbi:MAG: hypothetical protein ACYDCK_12285 [Thermoplasmatota archaeon]